MFVWLKLISKKNDKNAEQKIEVLNMLKYFKTHTSRSHKSQRLFLIKDYFTLRDLEAFQANSIHLKAWLDFINRWNKLKI